MHFTHGPNPFCCLCSNWTNFRLLPTADCLQMNFKQPESSAKGLWWLSDCLPLGFKTWWRCWQQTIVKENQATKIQFSIKHKVYLDPKKSATKQFRIKFPNIWVYFSDPNHISFYLKFLYQLLYFELDIQCVDLKLFNKFKNQIWSLEFSHLTLKRFWVWNFHWNTNIWEKSGIFH